MRRLNSKPKVLAMLRRGHTSREIAIEMQSSVESVQAMIEREYKRRGLANRHQLMLALNERETG